MKEHPLRQRLMRELHARPFTPLHAPATLLHVALVHGDGADAQDRERLALLCGQHGAPAPGPGASHAVVRLGEVWLKWEHHAEFTTWTFWRARGQGAFFARDAATALGAGQVMDALPGELLVAVHVEVLGAADARPGGDDLGRLFDPTSLCGSDLGGGATQIWTDFRPGADGFLRVLCHDHAGHAHQLGRRLQRVLEMETYRSMALLGLPVAQSVGPALSGAEARLQRVMRELEILRDLAAEKTLLAELLKLSAESEERVAKTAYRFSASRAYSDIVAARQAILPEAPLEDLPSLSGFIRRRLAPAMSTCESVRERQDALAARITRAANLLRTRVELALEAQNRDLLASMERRARLQLRLQQTVEGLSVAAITYYVVGLVGYLAKAASAAGTPVNAELATGLAVPLVAVAIWAGLRRFRRRIELEEQPGAQPGPDADTGRRTTQP